MSKSAPNSIAACFAVSAALVLASGCTSMFQPRSHRLLGTTHELSKYAIGPAPMPRELAKQLFPEHLIEPGDVLFVEPAEFNAEIRFAADQTVQPDGKISLGRYGSVHVAGSTLDQVRRDVEQLLEQQMQDKVPVHVRLVETEGRVYYVLGAVNSPGAYPVQGNETVLDAIIAAGGITDEADQGQIMFSRPTTPDHCRVVLPICYSHIVQLGDTSTNYQVEPGDRIYVPSLGYWKGFFSGWWPSDERCPRCGPAQVACPPGGLLLESSETLPPQIELPELIERPSAVPAEG